MLRPRHPWAWAWAWAWALGVAVVPTPARAGGDPCLSAVSITPMNGEGDGAIFEAVYGHCEGAETFRIVQIWFGDEVAIDVPHVQGGFEGGMFYFGDAPGSSCAPGQALELATPLATLDCAMSSATPTGNQMIVQWAVRFDPATFGGPRAIWFDAKGGEGDPEPRLGWTQVGSYDVQAVVDASTGESGSDDSGGTAGSVGAVTGGDAQTGSDTGADTGATAGDETGKLPGLNADRDDPSGCACTIDERSRDAAWLSVVLLVFACRRRRARAAEITSGSTRRSRRAARRAAVGTR